MLLHPAIAESGFAGLGAAVSGSIPADDFPARALEREISGSATVECTARSNGSPANCRVVSEEPAGMGFGRAAVRVVQRGQLSPRTVDGAAQDATFRVRVPVTLG